MIVAVIAAAGKSERMGRPKLILPLRDRLVIEHVFDALLQSEIDQSVVVVPPGDELVPELARTRNIAVLRLTEPTSDMRATVVQGLDFVTSASVPNLPDAFLLVLGDQPSISSRVIGAILDMFRRTRQSIIVPTYRGKRGHPVLFSWSQVAAIHALPRNRGINYLLHQAGAGVAECPIDDPGVVQDLDTPQDYARLLERGS